MKPRKTPRLLRLPKDNATRSLRKWQARELPSRFLDSPHVNQGSLGGILGVHLIPPPCFTDEKAGADRGQSVRETRRCPGSAALTRVCDSRTGGGGRALESLQLRALAPPLPEPNPAARGSEQRRTRERAEQTQESEAAGHLLLLGIHHIFNKINEKIEDI